MTEKILTLLKEFLKTNNIEDLDISEIMKSLSVDAIMSMISGNDEYVVKKSGNLEKFNADKLSRSIKNAADMAGMQLNSSDIAIILKDVADKLFHGDKKRLTRTNEVRNIVIDTLANEGFSKIRDAYEAYAQSQN